MFVAKHFDFLAYLIHFCWFEMKNFQNLKNFKNLTTSRPESKSYKQA